VREIKLLRLLMLLPQKPIGLILAESVGMISQKTIRINRVVVVAAMIFIEIIVFAIDFLKQNELRSGEREELCR